MSIPKWIWPLAIFLLLSTVFQFSSPSIPDLDSFYYIRLADLYKTRGLFNADFPWLPHTVIRSSSLWYGFGLFLIPFTLFPDLVFGIKAAGAILTAALLFFYFLVLEKRQIAAAIFWPFLLFFAAPNTMAHFLMTRPQTVSLILAAPMLFFISRRMPIGIFLVSFGIAWIHMNFAWLPLLIAGIFVTLKFILEKKFAWKKMLWSGGGVALGLLLRPDPIGALKLFYVQVLQQILEKQGGLPLLFGLENLPIQSSSLFQHFGAFLILWVAAIGIWLYFLFRKHRSDFANYWEGNDVFLSTAMLLSIIFFFLTVAVARRAYDFWVAFGVVGIAVVFTYIYLNFRKTPQFGLAKFTISAVFIFMVFYSGSRTINNLQHKLYPPDYLKESALWLKENSTDGDIVFNAHWSNFSPLFFWNQKNYYLAGLDPIFQYEYNPSFYWKFHYLAIDQVTKKTCGKIECTREELEDTYKFFADELRAKYILIEKEENPAVKFFLSTDPRFEKKFETKKEAIYLIKNE